VDFRCRLEIDEYVDEQFSFSGHWCFRAKGLKVSVKSNYQTEADASVLHEWRLIIGERDQ
jgi:hypothetical protein